MVSSWASSLSVALTDFFSSSFLPLSLLKSSPYVYLKLVAAPCVMDGVGVLSVVMFGPEMIVNTHNVIEVLIYESIECINSGFQFCSVDVQLVVGSVRFSFSKMFCSGCVRHESHRLSPFFDWVRAVTGAWSLLGPSEEFVNWLVICVCLLDLIVWLVSVCWAGYWMLMVHGWLRYRLVDHSSVSKVSYVSNG